MSTVKTPSSDNKVAISSSAEYKLKSKTHWFHWIIFSVINLSIGFITIYLVDLSGNSDSLIYLYIVFSVLVIIPLLLSILLKISLRILTIKNFELKFRLKIGKLTIYSKKFQIPQIKKFEVVYRKKFRGLKTFL